MQANGRLADDFVARPGAVVRMDPARVRSGHNDVQIGGVLTLSDGDALLDIDVAAESLDWDETIKELLKG